MCGVFPIFATYHSRLSSMKSTILIILATLFAASRHKRHCESRENKLTTNIRKHTNSRRTFAAGVFVSTRAPVPGYAHPNSKTGNSIHNIINCGFPCIIYFCPEIPICKSMDRRRFLKTAGLLAGGSMISGTQAINILKHQNKKMKITVLTENLPRVKGVPRVLMITNDPASPSVVIRVKATIKK